MHFLASDADMKNALVALCSINTVENKQPIWHQAGGKRWDFQTPKSQEFPGRYRPEMHIVRLS